jgi:NDP-sugar pyrophosphorylase family protein
VRQYQEKPTLDHWINIGYFIFSREALDVVVAADSFESALKTLVDRRWLNAFRHEGLHVTVNTLSELEDAETSLAGW